MGVPAPLSLGQWSQEDGAVPSIPCPSALACVATGPCSAPLLVQLPALCAPEGKDPALACFAL